MAKMKKAIVTKEYTNSVLKRLNGYICLVRGNHEELAEQNYYMFRWIKDYAEVTVEGKKIVLFHYGQRTWHHDLRGNWHLYGHSHGELPAYGKSFDIGVDSWNFTPVEFSQLKEKMDKMPIGDHPQFKNFVIEK